MPAGRRHERVDREARRDGQDDLRRRQRPPSRSGRRGCSSCSLLATDTGGLIRACAKAPPATTSAAITVLAMASGRRRLPLGVTFTFGRLLSGRDARDGDREPGRPAWAVAPAEHDRRESDRSRAQPRGTAAQGERSRRRAARRAAAPTRAGARRPRAPRRRRARAPRGSGSRPDEPARPGSESPCQPSPSRQWIVDSSIANPNDVAKKSVATRTPSSAGRSRGGATTRRPSSRSRSRTASAASQSTAVAIAAAASVPTTSGTVTSGPSRLCASAARSTDCGASA